MTTWDYTNIKSEAKEQGIKINDLLALAPINDPFYVGRPSEAAAAEWFVALWRRFGYGSGMHLRRVHYQIISQDPPVLKPDGTVYASGRGYLEQLGHYKTHRNGGDP